MKKTLAKKQILSLVLAAVLVCTMALPALASPLWIVDPEKTFTVNGLTFGIIGDDQVVFIDCEDGMSGELVIPSSANGYTVVGIDYEPFGGYVGQKNYSGITSITIPGSISYVPNDSFRRLGSLSDINVSPQGTSLNSYKSIDGVLYYIEKDNSLTLAQYPIGRKTKTFVIPDGVQSLESGSFWSVRNLLAVYVPESVTYIYSDHLGSRDNWTFNEDVFMGYMDDEAVFSAITLYGENGSYVEGWAFDTEVPFVAGKIPDSLLGNATTPTQPQQPEKPTAVIELTGASSWAITPITEAAERGIVMEELMIPNKYTASTTRAEFCREAIHFIDEYTRMNFSNGINDENHNKMTDPFTDVDDPYVTAAYILGIVNGVESDKFAPNNNISRQEAAVMVQRVIQFLEGDNYKTSSKASFADYSKVASWATAGIDAVASRGIMNGTGNNNFSPLDLYTHEQTIITFNNLYNYLNK